MPAAVPLQAVRQLRWLLASGAGAVKWPALAATASQVLQALVALAPKPAATGLVQLEETPLCPTPRIFNRLADPQNLPHLAQLLLTHDPALMEASARLLIALCKAHPAALHRLYSTGALPLCCLVFCDHIPSL